jgi:hypothetical protein
MLRKPDFILNWRFFVMRKKKDIDTLEIDMKRSLNQLEEISHEPNRVQEQLQKYYRVAELVDRLYDHIWIEYHLGYSFREIKAHILQTCPDLRIIDGQNFKPRKIENYFFQIERKGRVTGSLKLHFCRKHGILSALK